MAMTSLKPEPRATSNLSPVSCGHSRPGHPPSYTHLEKSLLQVGGSDQPCSMLAAEHWSQVHPEKERGKKGKIKCLRSTAGGSMFRVMTGRRYLQLIQQMSHLSANPGSPTQPLFLHSHQLGLPAVLEQGSVSGKPLHTLS